MVNWREIDEKWQRAWREAKLFEAKPSEKPKFYLTVAYPYVSGPMHIGHGRTYTVPDVIARFKRMRGFNVLFPMAYHFTGTPIVGAAKRVERRDPSFIKVLVKRYGIPEEELPKFEDPRYYAKYFAKESDLSYRKGMEWLGYSIDWRREFTTVDPHYSRFVIWQYHKLMDAGLIVKGKHPVKWCPNCNNPVTDHDLLEGEGVETLDFTLIKYRGDGLIFPAATLRPETVFGVTNIWLNPEVDYVSAEVGGEKWIVSREAVQKLREQGYVIGEVKPIKINFGGEVEVPITHKRVPILPAKFVDPDNATGVVGSVPSHAPYDYVALIELKRNPELLMRYGVRPSVVESLNPISLIELPGFGESPAIDVVRAMKIEGQSDPRLEEATAEVYRNEFARGVMRKWVPKYGGMPVSEAKLAVREDMIKNGDAATIYEFSAKPVICRCGTNVIVKVVEDQWFLNYADEGWKNKARECLAKMHLVPPETRVQFEHTINWLHEWPCTRRIGMGTPAPWDPSWIIESLSDSTIYMAYYTIAHIIKTIQDPNKLTDEVFDYVFYGKGDVSEIAESSGIDEGVLTSMRQEFEYWYPLDYRMSANELIPNHLTFHIFHHALIFPELCPRGIVSFGMAVLEGQKMSSSKGNIVAINEAVRKYGADVVRLYLMSTVEPWQDFDWRAKDAEAMAKNLERFISLAEEILSMKEGGQPEMGQPERWMLSRLQEHIMKTTESLESFETRKAAQSALFLMMRDIRWYMKRSQDERSRAYVLKRVLDAWVRLLAPFVPHVCEEIWSRMGKTGFVSAAEWPAYQEELVDKGIEMAEDYLAKVIEDIGEIMKVVKVEKPKTLYFYVAPEWKRRVCAAISKEVRGGKVDMGKFIRSAEGELGVKVGMQELAKFVQRAVRELRGFSGEELDAMSKFELDEFRILSEASDFLRKEFGAERVVVFMADDEGKYDPNKKSEFAFPLKPAIYIE
jgi:leucyl-tRNA synthetase